MRTITSEVEKYITGKPFLASALSQGIINLTSLSRIILPDIQHAVGKEIRTGAIVMALKRLSSDLEFRATHKIVKTLKHIGEITVRSSLNDYAFKASDTLLPNMAALIARIEDDKNAFFTSSRGVGETNIVVSSHLAPHVLELFKDEELLAKQEGLSSITVRLPKENVSTPGIYYFIFQRLSWEGVNIYEVISTSFEFTILVDEENVDKAFSTIKNLRTL